jgi:hypothetical protein
MKTITIRITSTAIPPKIPNANVVLSVPFTNVVVVDIAVVVTVVDNAAVVVVTVVDNAAVVVVVFDSSSRQLGNQKSEHCRKRSSRRTNAYHTTSAPQPGQLETKT